MPLSKPQQGINDLETMFPDIAREVDGWEPTTVRYGSKKKMPWKCTAHGHTWERTVNQRTSSGGRGCPYCTGKKVWKGFNDLETRFPEIAKEADDWDPASVTFASGVIKAWKCEEHGHSWEVSISQRTGHGGRGCPYCAGQRVWIGFNDLKSQFPLIAAEADGWDPSTVTPGSSRKKRKWKCTAYGHDWEETPKNRCVQGDNCPYCSNKRVLKGFNDLKTKFPEIAAEADGWDPTTVTPGSSRQKRKWKCKKCLKSWDAIVKSRTSSESGCPRCSASGFNPEKPAWFYLMRRSEEQQLGITNFINDRLKVHRSEGWILIEKTGPHSGQEVLDTETFLRQWLKKEIGLVPDRRENWYTSKMKVHSLAELKERSGIETSIF